PSAAHIPGMATIVQCNCGAEYRRTEEKFTVPQTGQAVCTVCGAALESWWKSTHVPTYELIQHPDRKPDSIATPNALGTPTSTPNRSSIQRQDSLPNHLQITKTPLRYS